MTRARRALAFAFLLALSAFAFPAFAANVTISGTVNFSALDGGPDDADHTVNGVFTVSGDLVINGTILCIDDSGRESACPMSFNVGHDLIINAGGAVFAENRTGTGSGAPIIFTVGHDFVMHGPTSSRAGAIVSSDSTSSSGSNGGDITANVSGAVTIESGATIDSGSANAAAGAIAITAGGHIDASGNVLAGPSRTILSTRLTDLALSGGTGNQVGGAITLNSTSFIQPGLNVGSNANIISQGQVTSAGPVMLQGCGIIVNGLVASLTTKDATSRVVLRSGKTITIDGRDLGVANATLGRNGKIRGDAPSGTAANHAIDLFAFGGIDVLGPDPAGSSQFAITGTTVDSKSVGAHVDVISLTGTVTASGNVANVSGSASGDTGGSISVSSQGDVNFDHAILAAAGDSSTNNNNRAGGSIALRSYSGNVIWTNGSGDVRPTGSASGLPAPAQGSISLTACGTFNISGSTFPSNGSPVGVFPAEGTACSPAAPSLPAGEPPLPVCCNVITITNPSVTTGTAGAPFSQTFTQSGAIGTATFSLASGTLPAGLTLASNGTLSGTPTVVGDFPIVVQVTDSQGCTGIGTTYPLHINCQTITVTNPSVTTTVAGSPFSATFTQSGAIGGATFSTTSVLPTGLVFTSNGVLSGTPTVVGGFPITVTATDGNGCTGASTYNLTITCQTITVTNPATASGVANTPFSQTFTQSGSIGSATFSTTSTLPAGLTLSSGGTLSGTPTQTGTFAIVVTATDANGCSGSGATYTLTIACQVITVNNPANASATAGSPFSATFTASNTVGATTFTTASTLPAGLTLSSGGVLSGTPTVVGTFPIVVTATDANGCSGTGPTYNLTIACQTITVVAPVVNSGVAGTPFSQTFTQSGAIGTATFSIVAGSLPSGLVLATNGVLSGTPLQTGIFSVTVKVTDANGCSGMVPYTLTIACPVITVANPSVSSGVAGSPFSQTFTESGAVGTATFSTSSTLPAGLSLSAFGVLSGTPTQTGTFPIVVTVTDANGCTGTGATYNLTIACQTITVTAPSANTGTAGSAFSASFTQSGAIGTATFSLASGSLPAGLTLAADGTLSGVPLQTGTFPITVTVTDSNGCTGTSATYTLTIVCQVITVTHPAVMSGTVGTAFSQQYTQSGGIGAVVFSTASTLPTGMTLAADGTLSGTPTQSGTFPITVTATDANGCSGSDTFTLTISCQTITVTNPAATTGTVGTPLSRTFTQSGGIGTVTFSESGALSAGLSFATNGTLSGTPTQPGTFSITVTATDSNGCSGSGPVYTLVISCQTIVVTNPATTTGTAGTPFSQTFTQSGGIGTVTFSTSSTLPSGLTLAANGTLSGTPTQTGTFPIVVTATDSNGCSGTGATYTLVIACQTITVTNPATTTGTVDAPFSQTFTESGALGIANFSLASGTLPAGLTLSTAGILSGTPQVPGTFPITVTVTDVNGCTGTGATYTLVINCQTITVTNPSASTATYNTPLSGSFTFTQSGVGAHTPAVFTLNSGALPSGVSLSPSGALSGTPTQTGFFTITVKVTDANGCSGVSAAYTLTVAPKITAKAYTDVGNTQLDGGLPAPATPTVVSVALSNGDTSDSAITYAITAPPSHGTLTTFNANGTFLYTPNVGNTAADAFSYTATSNGASVNATATISFIGRVWYVDNATASITNDGRSNTPFKTMTAVGGAGTGMGDFIYVSKGSGPTTGSYAMLASQQLIGAGATLTAGGVLTVPGAAVNTPTLSGTVTLATGVTVAGIDMSTGSSAAITGASVSGISVTARNVTTTTGVPISISGTANSGTIALTQVNANGAPNAIALSNFNGAFSVLGDGGASANGSGGTIQNTTGHAVSLTAVSGTGVSLNYLNISNSGLHGISANGITNLTVNRSNISDNAGSVTTDDGINVANASGSVTLTNDTITGSRHQGFTFVNVNTNLAGLTMSATTISGTVGGDGALIQISGTSTLTTGTISGCTFSNNSATGLQVIGSNTASIAGLTAQNNTITGNNAGMDFDLANSASMTLNVLTNTFNNHQAEALNLFSSTASTGGTFTAKLQGNVIGTQGVFNSGTFFGDAIRVALNGGTQGVMTIDGNAIHEVPNARGIDVDAEGYTSANHLSVEITNNQVVRPSGANGDIGCGPGVPCPLGSIVVTVDHNAAAAESLCTVITGNTAYDPTSWPAGAESAYYLARRSLQTFNLEGNTSLTPSQNILGTNTVTNLTSPGVGDFTDESGNVVVVPAGSCGTFP